MKIKAGNLLLALDLAIFIGHLEQKAMERKAVSIKRVELVPVTAELIRRNFSVRKVNEEMKYKCETHLQVLRCELYWKSHPALVDRLVLLRDFVELNLAVLQQKELDVSVLGIKENAPDFYDVLEVIAKGKISESDLVS